MELLCTCQLAGVPPGTCPHRADIVAHRRYANKCALAGLCDNVDVYTQKVFETGVDEMSWDDMDGMQVSLHGETPWTEVKCSALSEAG